MSIATRLYRGEVSYDFLSRRKRWYAISGAVVAISIISLIVRGLSFSIDFRGGDAFQFPSHGHSVATAQAALSRAGVSGATVQSVGEAQIIVQTKALSNAEVNVVQRDLSQAFGVSQNSLNPQSVGSSWGQQITNKAIEGLIIFLLAVIAYISVRFEPKMALAAIVALLHDLIITAGIYSLVGFTVSPATVIALLTILGFSLYDTVVVFDKVRENTADLTAGGRVTYSQAANLAVNQTLMRSINTSLISLLPVAALLFVGAGLLGAGTLKDLALAQFVGLASGAYSSIFVATPLLAQLKEREPAMQQLARKVARAQALRGAAGRPQAAAAGAGAGATPTGGTSVGLLERPDGEFNPAEQAAAPAGHGGSPGAARVPGAPLPRSGTPRRRGRPNRPSGKRKR